MRAPRRQPARGPALRPLPVLGTIGSHALRAGRSLHDSSLLDRLLRGRGWIGLLGVALIGLVALNVSLLKLNAQAGRDAEQARKLRIANTELRGRTTRLSSAGRLQSAGEKLGLVMPPPGSIHYLKSRPGIDGKLAARNIQQWAAPSASLVAGVADPATAATDPASTDTAAAPTGSAPPATQTPAQTTAPVTQTSPTGGGTLPPAATGTPGTG